MPLQRSAAALSQLAFGARLPRSLSRYESIDEGLGESVVDYGERTIQLVLLCSCPLDRSLMMQLALQIDGAPTRLIQRDNNRTGCPDSGKPVRHAAPVHGAHLIELPFKTHTVVIQAA